MATDRRGRRRGERRDDDVGLDDDRARDEAEVRPDIAAQRRRRLVVFVVVAGLLAYAAFMRERRDNEDDREAEQDRRRENIGEPDVTTTFADVAARAPVEPTCPIEPYSTRAVQFTESPPMCIEDGVTYVATVHTTRGEFEITLDTGAAREAVNSFVFLARWRFYEGSGFYQVVPDLAIDGGDPVGPVAGQGDPGYTLDAEPPTDEPFYPIMSVRMLAQADEAAVASEFSIVTGPQGETLPARDSLIGHVTAGETVIRAIEETGNQDTGVPGELTVIERITIEER